MFLLVLRKMLRNKWMVLCLLIGSVLAVATVSSMPIYSNSIFQRMLISDMERYQLENNKYPGQASVIYSFAGSDDAGTKMERYLQADESVDEWIARFGLPVLAQKQSWLTSSFECVSDLYEGQKSKAVDLQFTASEGIEDHVRFLSGAAPAAAVKDGYYEVMLSQDAMGYFGLSTGDTATVSTYGKKDKTSFRIKVSGVFVYADPSDVYWDQAQNTFAKVVVMNTDLFREMFLDGEIEEMLSVSSWYFALDYNKLRVADISHYQSVLAGQRDALPPSTTANIPLGTTLGSYVSRMNSLSLTLLILQSPVLLMLLLYIFMVSKLIVDYDANDIVVQKSRGASNLQLFRNYLTEGVLISAVALLVGPPLGYAICRFLGLSNGFLEFVSRRGVQVELVAEAYGYALLAVAAFLVTMLIPVLMTARGSVVHHKRTKSRRSEKPFWKKLYLDFVLMGVSVYGYISYQNNMKLLSLVDVSERSAIDPLLFLLSTIFVIAAALLFLRFYPLLIRLIFRIGRKRWSAGAYASLLQVARSRGSEFLMVFLITTISLGLFSGVAARTINTFAEDRVRYADGADLVLEEGWGYKAVTIYVDSQGNMIARDPNVSEKDAPGREAEIFVYNEPSFAKYNQLETIDLATKVMKDTGATVTPKQSGSQMLPRVTLMGIVPNEFGQLAWSRSDLLPVHINNYLNVLTQTPNAVFISRSMAQNGNLRPGDTVELTWTGQLKKIEVTVYGVVDYWPTINPVSVSGSGSAPVHFMIGNFNYLNSDMLIQPYQVWMRRAPDATTEEIYAEFEEKHISFNSLTNLQQDLVEVKNDPMLQGTNGTLTLSFLITMAVTFIGFLIFWIFNIRNRTLQFGILRAMGLSKRKLIGMIIFEQILISGVAILAGGLIGTLSGNLFVPLLQVVYGVAEQIPPFTVVAYPGDYLRVFAFLGFMLAIGLVVLGTFISRIKMDQALKLGED